jgi:hypothetical protein
MKYLPIIFLLFLLKWICTNSNKSKLKKKGDYIFKPENNFPLEIEKKRRPFERKIKIC